MKFVCISDLHEQWDKIDLPEGDVLLVAGDLTWRGEYLALVKFNAWLERIKVKFSQGIVVIAGNHDFLFEKKNSLARSCILDGIYLQDELIEIAGFKMYGTPWQPVFHDWAFNAEPEQRQKIWAKIPNETEILVVHGPPYGIGDQVLPGEHVGCSYLKERIGQLPNLRLVVFGHIHQEHGVYNYNGIKLVNASICNLQYKPVNKPIVIEFDTNKNIIDQ